MTREVGVDRSSGDCDELFRDYVSLELRRNKPAFVPLDTHSLRGSTCLVELLLVGIDYFGRIPRIEKGFGRLSIP